MSTSGSLEGSLDLSGQVVKVRVHPPNGTHYHAPDCSVVQYVSRHPWLSSVEIGVPRLAVMQRRPILHEGRLYKSHGCILDFLIMYKQKGA